MRFLSFFTDNGIVTKLIDHLPIQLEGEEAKAKRAAMQAKVDAIKVRMGDRYLLSKSVQRKSNGRN